MASQQTAVLYLQRKGFDYYQSDLVSGFRFLFPASAVRDLDVVNKEELKQAVQIFIDQNQLSPKSLIIIVSESVVFEKDYPGILPEQKQPVVQLFSDSIPFENIMVKTFSIENGVKAVATNKDLCLTLKEILEAKKFIVEAITPSIVLGTTLTESDTGLHPDSVRLLFEKYSFLKESGFALEEKKSPTTVKSTYSQKTGEKQGSRRLFVLIAFFFLLVFILIFIL